jgi:hypothetical protein
MEMSVGTIVTIVLLMTVLILGIFLVQNIFSSGTKVVDLTDKQLQEEVNKLFSKEDKLVLYPDNRKWKFLWEMKMENFGIGIKNLGGTEDNKFSYKVSAVSVSSQCSSKVNLAQAESWIRIGKEESNIIIAPSESVIRNVRIVIPIGAPIPCMVRYKIEVNEGLYASDNMDIILEQNNL